MKIEFSKVPEGATHFFHDQHGRLGSWWKVSSERSGPPSFVYSPFDGQWIAMAHVPCDILPIPDNKTWTGEGLPPVGTVCEWAGCTFAPEDPKEPDLHVGDQVTIIAHFKDGEFDLAAFTFNPQIHNPDRGTAWVNQGAHGCFRPIRTPEQIAAEEREEGINHIFKTFGVKLNEAIAIYDGGYRKQVKP